MCTEWGFRTKTRLLYIHCRDKSQRWRTAGCNKVYFSWYYVKLASLAELELFKKHSVAVVAVGSLNMHGGKCSPPPPAFQLSLSQHPPTSLPHPRAFLCLRMPSPPFLPLPAHIIILAHLRTLRSVIDTTASSSFFSYPSTSPVVSMTFVRDLTLSSARL